MSFINCKIVGDGVDYETYHRQEKRRGDRDYSMSRSELVEFAKCPAKWIKGPKKDDSTSATLFGSLIDCLVTQPDKFDSLYAVAPETYPDSKTGEPKPFTMASKWCKDWRDSQGDKIIIKSGMMEDASAAMTAIGENADASELIKISKKQVFVLGFWKDEATGLEIPVRTLLDMVPDKNHPVMGAWLSDLKTCRNGDPANWDRVVDDGGYDTQGALYTDIYKAATGEDRTDWIFLVVENIAPFHVVNPMPGLTAEFLAWGRLKYEYALTLYCRCLAKNDWPSYPIAGLQFGKTQSIGPEGLYRYKNSIGHGRITEKEDYKPEPTVEKPEEFDTTP
jgi:hypothetical protein